MTCITVGCGGDARFFVTVEEIILPLCGLCASKAEEYGHTVKAPKRTQREIAWQETE